MQCPHNKPQIYDKEIPNGSGGWKFVKEVLDENDVSDPAYCESFLSAIEKDKEKSGCLYKANCPTYAELKKRAMEKQ